MSQHPESENMQFQEEPPYYHEPVVGNEEENPSPQSKPCSKPKSLNISLKMIEDQLAEAAEEGEEAEAQKQAEIDAVLQQTIEEKYLSEQQVKKLKKQKKKLLLYSARRLKHILRAKPINKVRLVYQAYFFIMSVAVLVLSILSYRDQNVHQEAYDQFLYNWESRTIDDIKFTYTSLLCKDEFGSEYEPLFKYEWPGTYDGCDCSGNTDIRTANSSVETTLEFFKNYFIVNEICSVAELARNCKTVGEIYAKEFTSWSDGNFGKPFTLCAKRTSISYINNGNHDTNCSSEQITCGTGVNRLCIESNQQCPISEIILNTDSNYKDINKRKDIKYGSSLKLSDQLYLYYLRNTTMPIADVQVSEGLEMCSQKQGNIIYNISPQRIDYPLIKVGRNTCNDTDPLYSKIYTIDEEQFYLANNVVYLAGQLPHFKINKTYRWSLFTKPYISWSDDCDDQLKQDTINTGRTLTWVYIVLRVQLGVTIAYFIAIGIIFNIVGIMTALNFAWSCMTTNPKSQYNVIFMVEIIIKIVMQVAEVIVICIAFAIIEIRRGIIAKVNQQQCFSDKVTASLFRLLETDMKDFVWTNSLAILVIFAFSFLLDFYLIKQSIDHGSLQGASHHHQHERKQGREPSYKFSKEQVSYEQAKSEHNEQIQVEVPLQLENQQQ